MSGVAVVTGGRRGIGRAIALRLAREGFAVAVNAEVDAADLAETVADLKALGVPAVAVVADVSDVEAHDHLLDQAAALGPLTTLVNNAGVGAMQRGDPLDVTPESFDRCVSINARAAFFLAQRFAKRVMATPAGATHRAIINITSSNAVAVATNRAEYAISKAAASMASRALAVRLGGEGIGVYELQPGIIETDMTAPVLDAYRQRIDGGLTVTPRVGQADEVAGVAALCATGRLAYSTGQAIQIDGGLLIPRF